MLDEADVSEYQKTNELTNQRNDKEDENEDQLVSQTSATKRRQINQENDIISIIQGFSSIVSHCLRLEGDKTDDLEDFEETKKT